MSDPDPEPQPPSQPALARPSPSYSVSYSQLAIVSISLLIGLVAGLYISVSQTGETTTLTPMELIGFLVSILIGGASLVLAVVAISLGKMSERTLTTRGDDHLRLQTEIYTKTTEALQKIAASTDVTEKRIEDMIQGRVSDISHDLAKTFRGPQRSPEDTEKEIRRSIMQSMKKKESIEQREREKKEAAAERDAYEAAHQRALLAFANQPHTKVQKIFEHGFAFMGGEDLFDALYTRKKETIAMSTFRSKPSSDFLNEFVINSCEEIRTGKIAALVILLFYDDENERKTATLGKILNLVPKEIAERISVVRSTYENVETEIKNLELQINPALQGNRPIDDGANSE